MAKYKKFAIAESGALVDRSTGKMYRGGYTTRTAVNGVITVYGANGRKIGTVGKPTAKEKKKIDEIDKRNFKARQKAVEKALNKRAKIDWKRARTTGTWQDYVVAQETTRLIPRKSWKAFEISFTEQSIMNYAKALSEAVRSGLMSKTEANTLFNKYKDTANDKSKQTNLSKMWAVLNKKFDEIGFKYSVEVAQDVRESLTDDEYERILLGKE